MAKKIFISYDYDNDKAYRNFWSRGIPFDDVPLEFEDGSADISITSHDDATIKRAISAKINKMTYFLCIIGKSTHKCGWVKWEIDKAVELKKKIVAVKIDSEYTSPSDVMGVGASSGRCRFFGIDQEGCRRCSVSVLSML